MAAATLNAKKDLRRSITRALRKQGYTVDRTSIALPAGLCKNRVRTLHEMAVAHRCAVAAPALRRHEDRLIRYIANGNEVCPERVSPKLIPVKRGTESELLFRYASLHWSIPVSAGYGRRIRFLVLDNQNKKLIGLFGLGDPVYSVGDRDRWIGWDNCTKKSNL